jgi:putative peptide zinc metalloprotease protein
VNTDYWSNIKNVVFSTRSSVGFSRHSFRGELQYVVSDEAENKHFKINARTYKILQALDGNLSANEVFESIRGDKKLQVTQEDVLTVIRLAASRGILSSSQFSASLNVVRQQKKKKRQMNKQMFMNLLFMKIPIFSPNRLLKLLYLVCFPFLSVLAFWVYAAFFLIGSYFVYTRWEYFVDSANGILSLSNLGWVYVLIVLSKLLHELAHGLTCVKYGKQVTIFGIMLMVFTPLPYVDVSSIWSLSDKHKRILVTAAGMISDLFLGSISAIIWIYTSEGLIHTLAYNMVFIAVVSTFLFNINPLIRFDGYHMLCDYLEIPNLQQKANQSVKYLWSKYVGKDPNAQDKSSSRKEFIICVVYAVASYIYRILLMAGIIFFISKKFLILGYILAAVSLIFYLFTPIVKGVKSILFDMSSKKVKNNYIRFVAISFVFIVCLFVFIPMPYAFRSEGVISAHKHSNVYTQISGDFVKVHVTSGSYVKEGQVLVTLNNDEAKRKLELLDLKIAETKQSIRKFHNNPTQYLRAEESYKFYAKQRDTLEDQLKSLRVTAPIDGRFVYADLGYLVSAYLESGTNIGMIIDDSQYVFKSVVTQDNVSTLFSDEYVKANMKIAGMEDHTYPMQKIVAIPEGQIDLPSAALGILGGGEIMVDQQEGQGRKSKETFFEVRFSLEGEEGMEGLHHGKTGVAKFYLKPRSWAYQLHKKISQFLQREYQL